MKTLFHVQGTHCQSCKVLIEDVCGDIPGVASCNVDLQTGNMVLEHDEGVDLEQVKKEIEGLGEYELEKV
jgi:copper chaperone CopZ